MFHKNTRQKSEEGQEKLEYRQAKHVARGSEEEEGEANKKTGQKLLESKKSKILFGLVLILAVSGILLAFPNTRDYILQFFSKSKTFNDASNGNIEENPPRIEPKYLYVKEWGVRFKLSEETADTAYENEDQYPPGKAIDSILIKSSLLEGITKKYPIDCVGAAISIGFYRAKEGDMHLGSVLTAENLQGLGVIIGEYHYAPITRQPCFARTSQITEATTYANQQTKKVLDMLKTIEPDGSSHLISIRQRLEKYVSKLDVVQDDFVDFINEEIDFAAEYDECQKQKDSEYFMEGPYYSIMKNVRDKFIEMSWGNCSGGGIGLYYAKQQDRWVLAFRTQQAPSCDKINKFSYTKIIFPECYDEKSYKYITNVHE